MLNDATSVEEHEFHETEKHRTCWFFHRWNKPYFHKESNCLIQECRDCGHARTITQKCNHKMEPYASHHTRFYVYFTSRCSICGKMETHQAG